MVNISQYQGINQFGPAYKIMLENDTHATGSIDRVLLERMIRLCPETMNYLYSEYTPTVIAHRKETRPVLEQYVEMIDGSRTGDEERIEAVVQFTCGLQPETDTSIDSMLFGGTEEEIIVRGSDWCTDVARVGCALCQVMNIPSRMVYLADREKPYHGHAIIEVFRSDAWDAVDCVTNVIYRHPNGKPASTWELMHNSRLIENHCRDRSTYYTNSGQFQCAAISNYFVWQQKDYNYSVSKVNEYKRSVLELSDKGWPSGLRWIHNEDYS
jgi:hypothetical protein